MNNEKYTNSLIVVFSVYLAVFIIFVLGFLVPSFALKLWSDSGYYLLIGISFLPLIAAFFYSKSSRFQIMWGKEALLRYIIIVLCIISIVINGILVLPIVFI